MVGERREERGSAVNVQNPSPCSISDLPRLLLSMPIQGLNLGKKSTVLYFTRKLYDKLHCLFVTSDVMNNLTQQQAHLDMVINLPLTMPSAASWNTQPHCWGDFLPWQSWNKQFLPLPTCYQLPSHCPLPTPPGSIRTALWHCVANGVS